MTITNNNKAASPGESFEIVQTPIPKEFELLHRFWQASNYLSVGQIYLLNKNPLLRRPLTLSDVKTRLLGHFGTTPGQNFIYTHLNRIIREREVSMIYISGPGHGGPALVSQVYMEGTYTEYYPDITEDAEGMGKLFQQFSFPGGIPSHVAPETPGSMHEGGELGYCLSHAFGAVLDQPDLVVACVVGDGEAETGPLATSWHGNKFLNPKTDGVVLPILHLNGFKIANPTLLDRIPQEELKALFVGYGYEPIIVEGSDPGLVHPAMAKALDYCFDKISAIKKLAAVTEQGKHERPAWPMIIMRTPKGWTGPKFVDGQMIEGSYRSHQVPMSSPAENPEHLTNLVEWLMSYNSENLFDHHGRLLPELKALVPPKHLRMGNHPLTNPILRPLILPDFEPYGVDVTPSSRGTKMASDTGVFGVWLRDVVQQNEKTRNFRIFGPDETASNRLQAVFEVTNKQWMAEINQYDDTLAQEGRVMEMLSEHQCEGWLEGYLLTGRHGLLSSYEAFIHIITSMVNQHQKWYKMCLEIPWRNRLPSLNILLSSHVWRQDHNGFTHQDPGFIGHIATKRPEIVRIYLPPDANCLLSVMHHCLSSRHYINVVTAGKHPAPQWLTVEEARQHCERGISIWKWASNDEGCMPDVVMACAGDVPTLEALAAVTILRRRLPTLKVRFVNVVDLMRMNRPDEHPHGMNDEVFDSIFTKTQPVIFAFHAYIHLVEKLIAKRHNRKFLVKGYKEEGTISTAFDMTVMNELDRFHLVMDVCDAIESNCGSIDSKARWTAAYVRQEMQDLLTKHKKYIHEFGVDMDEITQWKWEVPEDGI